jgi:hypothetical protein
MTDNGFDAWWNDNVGEMNPLGSFAQSHRVCWQAALASRDREVDELRQRAYAEGRKFEFNRMKHERPMDPCYWDMHEENEIERLLAPVAAPTEKKS